MISVKKNRNLGDFLEDYSRSRPLAINRQELGKRLQRCLFLPRWQGACWLLIWASKI